ncbi:MAG TPA: hypothetical protein VIQ97_02080 [Prevotella sp.]
MSTMRLKQAAKRLYVSPTIELIETNMAEDMMQTISLEKKQNENATTGGDAKEYPFDTEMEDNEDW